MATSSGSHAFLAPPLSNLSSGHPAASSPPPGTLLMIDPGLLSQDSSQDGGASSPRSSGDARTIELDVVTSNVSVASSFPVQIPAPTSSVPSVQFASPTSTATMTSDDSPTRSASHPPAHSNSRAHREALESVLARAREFQETVDAIRDSPLPNESQPTPVRRAMPSRFELEVSGLQSVEAGSGSPSTMPVQYNPRTSRANSGSISPTLSSSPVPSSPIIDFGAYDEYILRGLDGGDVFEPETSATSSIDVDSPYTYGETEDPSRAAYLRHSQSSGQWPSSPIVSTSSERSFGSLSSLYVRGPHTWRRAERLQAPSTPPITSESPVRSQLDSFRSRPEPRSPPSSVSNSSARPSSLSSSGDPFTNYLDSGPTVSPTRDFHVQHTMRPSIPPIRTSQNGHTMRSALGLDAEIDRLHRLAELADQAPRLRYSSGSSATSDNATDGSAPPRGSRDSFTQPETRRSLGQARQTESLQVVFSHLNQSFAQETRARRAPLPSDDDVLYAWEDVDTASSRTNHSYRTSLDFVRSAHRRVEMAAASSRDLNRTTSPAIPRASSGSVINPSRRPISLLRNGTTSTFTPAHPLISQSNTSNPPRPNSPPLVTSPRFPPALGPFASRQPSAGRDEPPLRTRTDSPPYTFSLRAPPSGRHTSPVLGPFPTRQSTINSAGRDEPPSRNRDDSLPYTFSLWAPPNGRNTPQDPLLSGPLRLPPFEPVPPPYWADGDPVLLRSSQGHDTSLPDTNSGGSNQTDRRPMVRFVNGEHGSGSNDRPFWPSLSSSISSRVYCIPGIPALADYTLLHGLL